MRYVLADAARTDLLEIWDYLAEHADLTVADRVVDHLHAAMDKLAETPLIGHRREDLTEQPVRFWSVHSYLVVYDADATPIAVARVLHASRDLQAIIGDII